MRVTWELWENEGYGIAPIIPIILALEKSGAGASVPSAPQGLSLLNYSNPLRVFTRASDGENFFFFGRKDFVNLFHKAVVDFLSLCLGVFLEDRKSVV